MSLGGLGDAFSAMTGASTVKAGLPYLRDVPILGDIFGAGEAAPTSYGSSSLNLGPDSDLLKRATTDIAGDYSGLRDLYAQGPGSSDVQAGYDANNSLANMLQSYSQGGYMPNQGQIDTANSYAKSQFGAQQASLNNMFSNQQLQANQASARLGRSGNDPVIRNMLARTQGQQHGVLDAQQGAFASQYAQNMPLQNLHFANQFAQVRGGLATQALANKHALLGLSQQQQQNERNFQLVKAGHQTSTTGPAGGLLGGLGAVTGVIGSVAGIAGKFMGAPGAAGAGTSGGMGASGSGLGGVSSGPMTMTP